MVEEPVQVFMTQKQWDEFEKGLVEKDWVYNVVKLNDEGEIVSTIARYMWSDEDEAIVVENVDGKDLSL